MFKLYHSQPDRIKAYIQMHISVLLWGATGVMGRGIELNEGLLVWYRMIITTISLFLFIWLGKKSFNISRSNLLQVSGIGLVLTVHWLFFYAAIKYSNVSNTLSVFASTTLFTALIEPVITEKKFNKMELVYSLMAIVGIGIIFYSDTNSYSLGIVLALLAAFVGAFFNILNKKVVHKISSDVVSFYEILGGLVALTIFLPFYLHIFQPVKLLPNTRDWILLFILAIACTHVTLILSLNALKHLSAFTLNLAINLEPVYGIALAFLIFGENKNMNGGFFAGTAIIILSVILHSYFAEKPDIGVETI